MVMWLFYTPAMSFYYNIIHGFMNIQFPFK